MAPSHPSLSFLAVILTLLAMGVMSGVQAKPVGRAVRNLDITSSIKIGGPLFGEKLGPFAVGQELTLTCSTEATEPVSLSWWEGDTEQESSVKESIGVISSSFTIQTLRKEDNGRRFTCRDEITQTKKSIEIRINTDALEIIKDDNPIEDGEVLKAIAGEDFTINCIVQGYNPSAVSWWEDDVELESVASKSPHATKSVLSLKALTIDDRGRSLTCRSLNGQLSRTVILDVEDVHASSVQEEYPLALELISLFLILLIAAVSLIVFYIIKTLKNKKGEKRRSDTVMEDSKVILGGIVDNRWAKVSWESQYGKLVEIAP